MAAMTELSMIAIFRMGNFPAINVYASRFVLYPSYGLALHSLKIWYISASSVIDKEYQFCYTQHLAAAAL